MLLRRKYSIIIIFLLSWNLLAQSQYRFDHLSLETGFSQSITYQLAQDSSGNIWTATEEGVIRYNGYETFLYHNYAGLPASFNNRVNAIYYAPDHQLWISGTEGVARYNLEADVFEPLSESGPNLVKVMVAKGEKLFIGGFNGLWEYNLRTKNLKRLFQVRAVESLEVLNDGALVFGSAEGLYYLTDNGSTIREVKGEEPDKIRFTAIIKRNADFLLGSKDGRLFSADHDFNVVESLGIRLGDSPIQDMLAWSNGNIYVGTDGNGIYELSAENRIVRNFKHDVDDDNSLSSNGVYDLLLDREGILWVATYGGGVNKLNPNSKAFYQIRHLPNTSASLIHPFTRAIMEDETERIWFGTKNGISIWEPERDEWNHLLNAGADKEVIVMSLSEGDEFVWAGTYNDGLYRIRKSDLQVEQLTDANLVTKEGRIFSTLLDAEGQLWVGGVNQELKKRNAGGGVESYPVSHVKDIFNTSDGRVWTVGRSGLARIENGVVHKIAELDPENPNSRHTTINSGCEVAPDHLLLGTNGAGLAFYDWRKEKLIYLDVNDGLPADIVQGVIPAGENVLWVATTKGLAKVELTPGDTTVTTYGVAEGMVSTELNFGSFARLRDGKMLFGGVRGVTLINAREIVENTLQPRVVLEEIRLFNEQYQVSEDDLPTAVNLLDKLELAHDENAITIKFAGVSHLAPERILYRWRLQGLTEDWSTPATERQINFTNLPSGKYKFVVQAANPGESWGPKKELRIDVAYPWWRSTVAYLSYGALTLALILGGIWLLRFYNNRRTAEQQIAFFNNITHELKTPMAILLSSLDGLSKSEENSSGADANRKVKSTIKRLSALFEQLLNFHKVTDGGKSRHVNSFDPAQHLQELMESFTPLVRERSLHLSLDVENAPEVFHYDRNIFEKIVLNLVSNAIKYSRAGGNIEVRLKRMGEYDLEVEVEDDGIGIPKDQQKYILQEYYRARNAINSQLPGTGLGLMMVKTMVGKEGGSIRFASEEGKGTTFYLELQDRRADYVKSSEKAILEPTGTTDEVVPQSLRSSQILLVEDNDELRYQLRDRLGEYFKVATAKNGSEGLAKAAELYPDLIITDLIMPEMGGMEMSRAIREDIKLNHIPIFMLTVLHNSHQKVESIKNGVSEYMEKPINFNLLLAKINSTLNWRKKMRERYAEQEEMELATTHRNDREAQFIADLEQFTLQEITNDKLSVQDLCKHLGMSRTSLYMKLKSLIDLSPQDFIILTRLKYARLLLTEGGRTIKEVAYDSGFSNPKYFSTSFKKKFGKSPRDFQKSLGKSVNT